MLGKPRQPLVALMALSLALIPSPGQAQDPVIQDPPDVGAVEHPECTFFTPAQRDKSMQVIGKRSRLTAQVTNMRLRGQHLSSDASSPAVSAGFIPNGGNTGDSGATSKMGTIDRYIFKALSDAGVAPAPATTDQEFIRRVTLDLTGR